MTTSLFNNDDLNQLESKGITPEEAMRQVEALRYGFPYPNIIAPASLENGLQKCVANHELLDHGFLQ